MKTRPHLNITYLSERLQEALCDIFQYSVTTVTAPMGYGKTTAVSAFLKQAENDGVSVRRQSIYGDTSASFWKGFCRLFSGTAVYKELAALPFPTDENSRAFFLELLEQAFEKNDLALLLLHRRSASIDSTVGFRPSFCSGQTRSAGISSDSGQPEPHFLPQ